MYARTKEFKNKDGSSRIYLQIVENKRVNGKPTQKVVANLGRIENLQEGEVIDRLITSLAKYSEQQWVQAQVGELSTEWGKEWGPALIFRGLWEEVDLPAIFGRLLSRTKIENDLEEAAFAMVLNRLCDPSSKLGVDHWLNRIYRPSFEKLKLRHLYQALDFVAEHKEEIEEALFTRVRDLFNLELDLFLWDTTSTYFEGVSDGDLARYGFSKDSRPDRMQVVIGLLMTKEGIPVAHHVFPGNTNDVDTFKEALAVVKERFKLRKVVLVGDRGMVSEKRLTEIEEAGLEYIVGVKMRKIRAMSEVLSRRGRYSTVKDNLKVKEVQHEGKRYIVCLNPDEAIRDQKVREQIVEKLGKRIAKDGLKSLIGNSAYRKFLKIDGPKPGIDQQAIKDEAVYDGKYVLLTNNREMKSTEVALAYKDLWRVERAFREMKSGLDLRPVYHWTDSRIQGHIMICFLAFLLESALRRKLEQAGQKIKYSAMMEDLKCLLAVQLIHEGKTYLTRTQLTGKAYDVFKALGMRPPNHMQVVTR